MITQLRRKLSGNTGFSILEVLIAALITGILAASTFQFYTSMHGQSEIQYDVSETQHLCRASLHDIKKNLRMAGYKITGHPSFEISGDSLSIYYSDANPVDTVTYYLEEFSTSDYYRVKPYVEGMVLYKLMRRVNSESPAICTDFIQSIRFVQLNARTISISVTAQSSKMDDTYQLNNGFRTYSMSERVTMRNVS